MNKKFKILLALLFILILIPPTVYVSTYLWQSRISMYFLDGRFVSDEGETVWAFGSLRQQLHIYLDPQSSQYQHEMEKRKKYLLLIKIDRYLFGNYHVLEDNLPNLGG